MTTAPDSTPHDVRGHEADRQLPRPAETPAVAGSPEPGLTAAESRAVDRTQDEIMSRRSVDGRPPTHRQRRIAWRLVLIVLPALALASGVVALTLGAPVAVVVGIVVVFVLVFLIMGSPVWMAGLSRGREEAAARVEAVNRLQARDRAGSANRRRGR